MSTTAEISALPQRGGVPPTVRGRLTLALAASVATVALTGYAAWATVQAATTSGWRLTFAIVMVGLCLLAIGTLVPVATGFRAEGHGSAAVRAGDLPEARRRRHRAGRSAWVALGYCLPLTFVAAFALFLLANDHAVQQTFFSAEFMAKSAADVTSAFKRNVFIAVAAEVLVLVWGMVVAIARLAPGPAGRPVRWLATAYVDVFRAIPAIIVIYLIGFGLPLAQVPLFSSLSPLWAAVLALTLTYGAYVAEVYRAGIESIHWSQVSAARSLGLSYSKTMRFVVVPQAVRRVTPPLLNDFIGLQKDTALVTVIGTVDAFTQSKTYASNYFNLSSVTVVAALFIIITIPQTRFVDRMLERDIRRQRRS
jgi:polar amino acid transport system permease protein